MPGEIDIKFVYRLHEHNHCQKNVTSACAADPLLSSTTWLPLHQDV